MWQIRHIIDGIARTDSFDTADDTFSISLATGAAPGMTGEKCIAEKCISV